MEDRCAIEVKARRARSAPAREAVRERLCDAAAKLLVEEGEAALSMRRLAAEVGCSAMAPYRYFADKQALIAAIRTAAFDRLSDALDGVAARRTPPRRRYRRGLRPLRARESRRLQTDVRPRPAGRGRLSRARRRRRPGPRGDGRLCPRTGRGRRAGRRSGGARLRLLGGHPWPDRARPRRPHPRRPRLRDPAPHGVGGADAGPARVRRERRYGETSRPSGRV